MLVPFGLMALAFCRCLDLLAEGVGVRGDGSIDLHDFVASFSLDLAFELFAVSGSFLRSFCNSCIAVVLPSVPINGN